MWNNNEYSEFIEKTRKEYEASEMDIDKICNDEFSYRLKYFPGRKTQKRKEEILLEMIDDISRWLKEDRKTVTPVDLVSYRTAKNYFVSIKKRTKKCQ